MGSSRCAELLGGGGRTLFCGGAPAVRGCSIKGRKRLLFWGGGGGGGPDMRLLDQRKRLLHGDLPLLLRCAELLGWGRKEAAFGGSSRCVGC